MKLKFSFRINDCRRWHVYSPVILTVILSFACHAVFSQSPEWMWAKGFNGIGWSLSYSSSTVAGSNGDVYSTGSFSGIVDFDPGPAVFNLNSEGPDGTFISRLDSDGNFVWAKSIGALTDEGPSGMISSITLDASNNVYVCGAYYRDSVDFDPGTSTFYIPAEEGWKTFIVKLDGQGNFIWARTFAGEGSSLVSFIGIDRERGSVYVTGYFEGSVDFDPGSSAFFLNNEDSPWDIFVTKLNLEGQFVWAKSMGGPDDDRPFSLAIDSSGSIYVTGTFWDVADFDPGPSLTELVSHGAQDFFVVKLNENGNLVWAKSWGSPSWDSGNSITNSIPGNNIFITGYFTGTVDFDPGLSVFNLTADGDGDTYILKLNPAGELIWVKSFPGLDYSSGYSIACDQGGNGGVYATGFFRGTTDFDPGAGTYNISTNGLDDIFICKLNSSGEFAWAYGAGGYSFDYGTSIALDKYGFGYITGFIQSNSGTFGATTIQNTCNSTSFVSKFYACNGIVSNVNDSGIGSLRDAIYCSADNALITFAIPTWSQIILTSGEILVKYDFTLRGTPGYSLSVSGNNASRIFNIWPGKHLAIQELALIHANAPVHGGAILMQGGLTLENMLLGQNFENAISKSLTILNPTGLLKIVGDVELKQ